MRNEMGFRGWRSIVVFLVAAMMSIVAGVAGNGGFANIDSKLKAIRKLAVKSIQSSDGDVIDCVSINNQPAFDHPALKNHAIQMKPSFILEEDATNDKNKSSSSATIKQIWHKSGSCPDGTVPIRRVKKQDLLRFDNIERFGMKAAPPPMDFNNSYPDRTLVVNNANVSLGPRPFHSCATLLATAVHYAGARGSINIWNPRVARWDEYSTGQLWLMSGNPNDLEAVEAGWIVYKKLYGDTQTRLFTYWTSDASEKTGCFDVICSGFVQTSTEIALGAAFNSISTPGGQQYIVTVQITLDTDTGNWWLALDGKTLVGYWPGSLFTQVLRQGASFVQWGGEVYSTDIRKIPHTTTAMGSEEFGGTVRGYNSYIEHIAVLQNPNDPWAYPRPNYIGLYVDEKNCYYANHYVPSYMEEPTLFFGGPGQNSMCP